MVSDSAICSPASVSSTGTVPNGLIARKSGELVFATSTSSIEVADASSPDFLAINPFGTVPVLETEAGEHIAESLTICRFLDRQWQTGLFGRSEQEQLHAELWERRSDLLLYSPAIEYVHQAHPMFAGHVDQHPDWARVLAERGRKAMAVFNRRLDEARFLAGDAFTMADITAFLGVSAFAGFGKIGLGQYTGLSRWSEEVGARPSMERLRALTL